jgi:excisionase family DNA binding protein
MADWITTSEAARLSAYHAEHLRELVREGKIRGQKFGTTWQISRTSLLAYVQRQMVKGERRGPKPKLG